jgi:excisionase family DNA binding protein
MTVPAHDQPSVSAPSVGPGDDVLLRPGEVSRLLGVDPKTLTRWADSGRLPAVVLPSGHRRYRFGEVRAVLHPAKAS